VYTLSERAKLNLLGLMLVVILGLLGITAVRAFQAVREFQQQYSGVRAGNVSTLRPWMTVYVISRVYHVPENYLYRSLTLDNASQFRHATLYVIADQKRQSVDQVIRTTQHAILVYRKHHALAVISALTQHTKTDLSSMAGRTVY
jgi:hypothetical protein